MNGSQNCGLGRKAIIRAPGNEGVVEYIVVLPAQTARESWARESWALGKQATADFTWIKTKNRNDLGEIFHAPHIEKLEESM